MKKKALLYNTDDTICAISTPIGEGGIGIVRLSGKKALSIADKIFVAKDNSKPSTCKTYTIHYGHIIRRPSEYGIRNTCLSGRQAEYEIIDEVILTVMRAPRTYTKEDVVEINCHGGIVPLRKVLDLVLSVGARLAEPGEFTKRAFINGRIDLTQAEAVLDIIQSKTEDFMKVAIGQLEGQLSKNVNRLKGVLLDVLGEIEACIDFQEEDIEFMPKKNLCEKLVKVSKEIKKLIDNAWKGMILREGILCVICGKPNVGKSSLMNALLRRNRVIVTPVPGTTRDAIEEEINLKGIPIRIVDTAGISRPRGVVERHGIRKSASYIKMADLILFMLDLSTKWSKIDEKIFMRIKDKSFITIANKSDLTRKLNINRAKKLTKGNAIIEISILKRKNLDKIEELILQKIWHGEILHPEAAFVTNLRHKKDLECTQGYIKKAIRALNSKTQSSPEIVASDIKEAVLFLGSILGDTIEPDILERIFSKFCIGK